MKKMICLDYDGSYTRFPELFDLIIDKAGEFGYEVILATMRYPEEADDTLRELSEKIPVYYTSHRAKLYYLLDELGIIPDLWIDDLPRYLFVNG